MCTLEELLHLLSRFDALLVWELFLEQKLRDFSVGGTIVPLVYSDVKNTV